LSTHLVIPDTHTHWEHGNERATWLSNLVVDVHPDVVVFMGDHWDFPSLASYDRGLRAFIGRTYRADVDIGLDFNDRFFSPLKRRKKKLPRFVFLEGNHEHRIERALDTSPELVNSIGFGDLHLGDSFDDVIRYDGNTPGQIEIDGVTYAHYFVSGISGRPISSEHSGFQLINKLHTSCTGAHSHTLDYCLRVNSKGEHIQGLVAGCCLDYHVDWAGDQQRYWWRGVILKRNVEKGMYNPEFIGLDALKEEYND